ncbi:MAG: flagellar biosynthetic protein FliO [Methylocystis sp.]|nr:flagellar biosynthetic protein FliO [Methylocystis sp.]
MPASVTQPQLLLILAATLAFLVAALLVLYMVRLVFGRRVKAPGARNRTRRLDVVDAFDLDRDRQLVIIRRDNIEHLLMIGGPNDVVVEASINRIESRDAKTSLIRQEEPAAPTAGWPAPPGPVSPQAGSAQFPPDRGQPPLGLAPGPAPTPSPPPAGEPAKRKPFEPAPTRLQPLPSDLFAPAPTQPAAAPTPEPPSAAASATPPPPSPAGRVGPAGLGPGGLGPGGLRQGGLGQGGLGQGGLGQRGPGFSPQPRPAPTPGAPAPPFLARAQKGAPPVPAMKPREPAQPATPPAPTPAPPGPPPTPETTDPLEALEAEMARLLGRPDQGT